MDKMQGNTKLQDLLIAIQRKSGIPPKRQMLMAGNIDIDTNQSNKTLSQLHLSNDCHILILDTSPDEDLELLPSPKKDDNESNENNENTNNSVSNNNNNPLRDTIITSIPHSLTNKLTLKNNNNY